jgi:replicative DNA helicase
MDLDSLFGGWMPGADHHRRGPARHGKVTLALDFARAAAITNQLPTVMFSMEMGRDEIKHRLYSAQAASPCTTSASRAA